ncbi:uncharacterized protein LOC117514317 [Thalassophryne amazonica]|uniref:uncharacterized protein LOC117514317 n=1 Tax=Thalassophryne amazonica TaxID=390379 RepID=UPI001470B083|nr:uncharacterized protein LOC117514317 [Thalassophryne amazonica]
MQSQGSISSQPSFDSLSSGDSLVFSDSEQAEDDADVFLTDSSSSVMISGTEGVAANRDRGSESPASQWTCDAFNNKEEEEEPYRSEGGGKEAASMGAEVGDPARQTPKSQGDLLFAQKCAELQGFIRPLLELLNGLKRGRFDRGLSSFQQSVAMDRIQRIVGVLQRPSCGEKYLNTLLQVEMMLKLWFPQVPTHPVPAASSVSTSSARPLQDASSFTPPHKHRNQLHIPVKKRRLSWTGTDSPTPSPVLLRCPRLSGKHQTERRENAEGDGPPTSATSNANRKSPHAVSDSQVNEDTKEKDCDSEEFGKRAKYKIGQSSEPSLTWVHIAPILSPRKSCPSHESTVLASNNENQLAVLPPRNMGSPAMQDSSISSTTPYRHPKNVKKPTRCQSQPAAGGHSEGETNETAQGHSHCHHITLQPLPKVCPTPVNT